jgi:hypothetical protein
MEDPQSRGAAIVMSDVTQFPPRPESRALLSPTKRPNCILQSLHVGEPQGCGRGVEAPKLCRQRGDTGLKPTGIVAITVFVAVSITDTVLEFWFVM